MSYRNIVLSGASGGLGHALVVALAAPGVHMLLLGRDEARLSAVAALAEAKGAVIAVAQLDLQDRDRARARLQAFDQEHPVDLFVANAGVKAGNELGSETPGTAERVLDVNVQGTIACVEALLGGMRMRGQGQIAILSSLAAISPQADLISYSASKAGLRGYGVALRRALRGSGVGVSIVTPGFIDTPMTDRQIGPTPFLVSAEDAAQKILRGLEQRRNLIAFPLALVALTRLGNLMPSGLGDWFNAHFRAKIEPDRDESDRV